jgi:hypothetical protein
MKHQHIIGRYVQETTKTHCWALDVDSNGDPVLRIDGRIVLNVTYGGDELHLLTATLDELGLNAALHGDSHPDDF